MMAAVRRRLLLRATADAVGGEDAVGRRPACQAAEVMPLEGEARERRRRRRSLGRRRRRRRWGSRRRCAVAGCRVGGRAASPGGVGGGSGDE